MEEILSKYNIKSISKAFDEVMEAAKSPQPYLKTGIVKLDKVIRGVEMNKLVTIGGISGSGKSALANIIETNIAQLHENVIILDLSFEMTAKDQVLRKLSAQENISTSMLRENLASAITGGQDYKLNPASHKLKALKISYVEQSCTVAQIAELIESFQRRSIETGEWLVVFIDHALLVEGKSSEERSTIGDLQKKLISLKKRGRTTIFQLMQLNRNIEAAERRTNRHMHYPQRSDLSTADAVYQASDYVWIIHRPELLGIQSYGPAEIPSSGKVFLHIIKAREGEPCNLLFDNKLEVNKLE